MTDLTPNDLSHLSDEEFNALCPQGEHAPGAEPLSRAAQAVLDAATEGFWRSSFNSESNGAAAALRAAAHHLQRSSPWPNDVEGIGIDWCTRKLHNIAYDLEGTDG